MGRTVMVKHAFWHDNTFYTAGNAQDVLNLPPEVQQAHIDVGGIVIMEEDGTIVKDAASAAGQGV
jgi:hypothetical protein